MINNCNNIYTAKSSDNNSTNNKNNNTIIPREYNQSGENLLAEKRQAHSGGSVTVETIVSSVSIKIEVVIDWHNVPGPCITWVELDKGTASPPDPQIMIEKNFEGRVKFSSSSPPSDHLHCRYYIIPSLRPIIFITPCLATDDLASEMRQRKNEASKRTSHDNN
ncbi:hypothetical protein HELRODRAFT_170020 [Helobdella robusta]|uniref:Uncharacterized protein n=1 Tax=Helobdella robusta TaxID=6412 RepID=T1F2J6_HELRO|nr:hypothetical protein HELRODRAFT_170020 [Helobdella robusta]ESO07488.1 hypothetical protein HELRODRAFT_170020 [Helobdella robusta]